MAVGDAHVFPGFPKPLTTFFTCFSKDESRKYAGKKFCLKRGQLSGVFSPLTSAEACEKSSRWLWKGKLCWYWCETARKHICVTDRHDMTLAVKVALNPNTTNNQSNRDKL